MRKFVAIPLVVVCVSGLAVILAAAGFFGSGDTSLSAPTKASIADRPLSSMTASASQSGTSSPSSDAPSTGPCGGNSAHDTEYLIFWPPLPGANSESLAVGEFAARLGTTGDGANRRLGFGVGIPVWSPDDWKIVAEIKQGFDTAKRTDVAVHFNVDDHIGWEQRPDLWNWYDPVRRGYNPENRKNVEWYDWDRNPNKRRYFSPDGISSPAPHMCYNSDAVQKEITRIISQVVGPSLLKEIEKLRHDNKEYLFAGITVGAEAGFDDYSSIPNVSRLPANADPMQKLVAKMITQALALMDEDEAPRSRLGYCALTNAGYGKNNPPADINQALTDVDQKFIEFWDKQFVDAGLSCSRIYTHVAASPAQDGANNAPIRITFNPYARPGWTTYPIGTLKDGFQPLYSALAKHDDRAWGGVEANATLADPTTTKKVSWEAYLAWHFNHGAKLVGINVGATDQSLMSNLSQGAFGDEAIAAYKKFLSGEPLSELATAPALANTPAPNPSPGDLDKDHRQLLDTMQIIQRESPAWLQAHPGRETELGPLFGQLDTYLKENNTLQAQQTAETILRLIQTH